MKKFESMKKENTMRNITKIIIFFLFTSGFLGGCEHQKLLLIYLQDSSASCINDSTCSKNSQQVCHATVESMSSDALYSRILVNSEVLKNDPQLLSNKEIFHKKCNEKLIPKGVGTFVCPSFELSQELIHRHSNYTPIVVNHIQTNEQEKFCPETLKKLMTMMQEKKGKMIVVGSTDTGNTKFNYQMWEVLKKLPNNHFCDDHSNVRACTKNQILNSSY